MESNDVINGEDDDEDLVGQVDEDDARLLGLFQDGKDDDNDNDNGDRDDDGRWTHDGARKRRLDSSNDNNASDSCPKKKTVDIQEDAILDCFQLAVASHTARQRKNKLLSSTVPTTTISNSSSSRNSSNSKDTHSFAWSAPPLYASTSASATAATTTRESQGPNDETDIKVWQPQSLDLPLWALALVRPHVEFQEKEANQFEEKSSEKEDQAK